MQPQVIIRAATEEDFAQIAKITEEAYLAAGYFSSSEHPYLQRIRDVAQRAACAELWVAERSGTVIASVTLAQAGQAWADIAREGELEFRLLVVDPAVQRSGAGRAMVEAILAEAKRREGVHTVSLTTGQSWAAARALYEKLDFVRTGERDWIAPDGQGLIVYTKSVSG